MISLGKHPIAFQGWCKHQKKKVKPETTPSLLLIFESVATQFSVLILNRQRLSLSKHLEKQTRLP